MSETKLHLDRIVQPNEKIITNNYDLLISDQVVYVDASLNDVDITLFDVTNLSNRIYSISRIDESENHVYLKPRGSSLIDRDSTFALLVNCGVSIGNDNTNWFSVVAKGVGDTTIIEGDATYIENTLMLPPIINNSVDRMWLDSVDSGADFGNMFGLQACVDFLPDETGSVQTSFNFPDEQDFTTDVNIDLNCLFNDDTYDTSCRLITRIYIIDSTSTPALNSPDFSYTDNVILTAENSNILYIFEMVNAVIPQSALNDDIISIVVKLTRDGVNDSNDGTFKVSSIVFYQ